MQNTAHHGEKYIVNYIPSTTATNRQEIEAYKVTIRIAERYHPELFNLGDPLEQEFVLFAYEDEKRDWYLIHEYSGLAIITDGSSEQDLKDKFIQRLYRIGNVRKFAEILASQESVYRRVMVNYLNNRER